MNYQQRIYKAYQVLPAYSYLSGVSDKNIISLANLLTGHPPQSQSVCCGESGLNADQTPLQLCITSTANDIQCRLIADPCSDEPVPELRYNRARKVLADVLGQTNSNENTALIEALLKHFSPHDSATASKFNRGVFWIAASAEKSGIAIYTDSSPNEIGSGWDKAQSYIDELQLGGTAAFNTIERIREYCWLSSIGIEGSKPENSRIKLYARMYKILPNGIIGELFEPMNELIRSGCLASIMGKECLSFEDVLFNFGFNVNSGEIEDMKIDLSGSALRIDSVQLEKTVSQCCEEMGLRNVPIKELFDRFNLAPSFIGVAITARGKKRLNVYLKGGSV